MAVYEDAVDFAQPGASFAELDRRIREGIAGIGFPGQPSHPICHGVGARAHEPPYAHQAGGGEMAAGMVLAIEPGCYIEGGGGLRVEDNFLITERRRREAVAVPGWDSPARDARPLEGVDRRSQREGARAAAARRPSVSTTRRCAMASKR